MQRAAIFVGLVIACSRQADPPRGEPAIGRSAARSAEARAAPPALDPTREPAAEPRPDPEPARPRPASTQAAHPIEIVLRSSPPGATAAVDGVPSGPTPTYWAGAADGHEHEFTFVLVGYASARYRFVPITSGVVHARLEVLADDSTGIAEPARPIDAPAPALPAGTPRSGPGPQP